MNILNTSSIWLTVSLIISNINAIEQLKENEINTNISNTSINNINAISNTNDNNIINIHLSNQNNITNNSDLSNIIVSEKFLNDIMNAKKRSGAIDIFSFIIGSDINNTILKPFFLNEGQNFLSENFLNKIYLDKTDFANKNINSHDILKFLENISNKLNNLQTKQINQALLFLYRNCSIKYSIAQYLKTIFCTIKNENTYQNNEFINNLISNEYFLQTLNNKYNITYAYDCLVASNIYEIVSGCLTLLESKNYLNELFENKAFKEEFMKLKMDKLTKDTNIKFSYTTPCLDTFTLFKNAMELLIEESSNWFKNYTKNTQKKYDEVLKKHNNLRGTRNLDILSKIYDKIRKNCKNYSILNINNSNTLLKIGEYHPKEWYPKWYPKGWYSKDRKNKMIKDLTDKETLKEYLKFIEKMHLEDYVFENINDYNNIKNKVSDE